MPSHDTNGSLYPTEFSPMRDMIRPRTQNESIFHEYHNECNGRSKLSRNVASQREKQAGSRLEKSLS